MDIRSMRLGPACAAALTCALSLAVAAAGTALADGAVPVRKAPDLVVEKKAETKVDGYDHDGKEKLLLTYTIKVKNEGEEWSQKVFVFDCLPDGFVPKEVWPDRECEISLAKCDEYHDFNYFLECKLDPLAPWEREEVVVEGKVEGDKKKLVNTACAYTDNEPSRTEDDNCDTIVTRLDDGRPW